MPILCEFDTTTVRPWDSPKPDTETTISFPYPLVARPRLPHGTRELDMGQKENIRVDATIPYFTNTSADCHITTWGNSTLHSAIEAILVLPPCDLDFLTGEHTRGSNSDPADVRIQFERPFVTPPKVVVFLNHLDLDKNHNWHLNVRASDIDATGFTLHIETWGDTILYGVKAGWVAYPEDRPHIFSTSFNTLDVRPATKPDQRLVSKEILFGGVKFWETPSVFVALNYLDFDCQMNLRVKAYVDNVFTSGLECHIDTWSDTILRAAGASIIAFN